MKEYIVHIVAVLMILHCGISLQAEAIANEINQATKHYKQMQEEEYKQVCTLETRGFVCVYDHKICPGIRYIML